MGNDNWQVEKQPAWLVAAIKKTISTLPGGYAEAAEWLGVSENALFNRLRTNGDQIFPMGWAMIIQQASGTKHIADAVSRQSNSVNVPLVDAEDVCNGDINERLLQALEQISSYSHQVREAIADGVIDKQEKMRIDDERYLAIVKLQEHSSLLYRVFCEPEKVNAAGLQPAAFVAIKSVCGDSFA
ncbi:DNA-binding protein [Pantoea sp. ICBG 1758]|uniref:YmfL family putative regulatory protein n=1 Tax=Pantoea sp. ICBG 1758 TaxID=2071682 RepID=UPI000CE48B2E|nr:YmfL family putative regulatory protein [Pantoea sp. ICBG 1758]PPC64165.1 DNA-binding protein [Pantoea sp. ICBG 1758]